MLVKASAEEGVVEVDAEEMLHAVFDFGDLLVRQVMIPRTEMIAVPADAKVPDILDLAAQNPFTKFPVYGDNLDQILGIIHLKDLIPMLRDDENNTRSACDLMREAIFIPETARVSTLLHFFRMHRRHITIVLDEYGGTAGIVTLEDLLEEIVGEVSDPFDHEQDILLLRDGSALIDGLTLIEEVNEHFSLNLQDPHYDTIAGYVLGKLERLAQVGDVIIIDGFRLRVEDLDGFRIARISIQPLTNLDQQSKTDAAPE